MLFFFFFFLSYARCSDSSTMLSRNVIRNEAPRARRSVWTIISLYILSHTRCANYNTHTTYRVIHTYLKRVRCVHTLVIDFFFRLILEAGRSLIHTWSAFLSSRFTRSLFAVNQLILFMENNEARLRKLRSYSSRGSEEHYRGDFLSFFFSFLSFATFFL